MTFYPSVLALLIAPALAAGAEAPPPDQEDPSPAQAQQESLAFGLGWLDQTQAFASNQANAIASQVDRFFGVPRSDLEAAYSSLRLTLETSWLRMDGFGTDVKVRGRVHLPRITERISLIFSEDEGDGSSYYARDGGAATRRENTNVNLELNLADNSRHRLDFRVGLRSSLKGRGSARYRYERPLAEDYLARTTQTAYFKDGDGFGSISRFQLDRALDANSLLRWTNDIRFEESYTGARWASELTWLQRRADNTGLSWYLRVNGETSPDFISAHDIGLRLRRNIGRPWLFIEVEPGYTWHKESNTAARESSPFIFVRFEMAIGRLDD